MRVLVQLYGLVGVVLVAQEAEGRGVVPPPHPLGAPDTFTLFHPVLPLRGGQSGSAAAQTAAAADTDRTVPVFQLTMAEKGGEKVSKLCALYKQRVLAGCSPLQVGFKQKLGSRLWPAIEHSIIISTTYGLGPDNNYKKTNFFIVVIKSQHIRKTGFLTVYKTEQWIFLAKQTGF